MTNRKTMHLSDAKTTPRSRSVATAWTRALGDMPSARVRPMGDAAVFACAGMENTTQRHAATILCTTGVAPLRVECGDQTVEAHILAIKPMVLKTIRALDRPVVLIDMEPSHPLYRYFHGVDACGVQALARESCPTLMAMAGRFESGALCGAELDRCARQAIDEVAKQFPKCPPLDRRVIQLMYMLTESPGASLEALATTLGMSAHHASRLFSTGLGIPTRRYLLSCKIRAATSFLGSGRPLTEIAVASGFVDSAHFSKVWTQNYGSPPSQFYNDQQTRVDTAELPDWLEWYLAHRDADLPRAKTGSSTPWLYRPAANQY